MIHFQPHGPFEIPIRDHGLDESLIDEFWAVVTTAERGLPEAVGCYIFAIRTGRGVLPWYVGKTDVGFKKEVFQLHKFKILFELKKRRRGTVLLYLIAKQTPGGRFAKPGAQGHRWVALLEGLLIGTSLGRNEKLFNKHATKHFREIQVLGYMNESQGARSQAALRLARLLGVAKNVRSKQTGLEEQRNVSVVRRIGASNDDLDELQDEAM